MGMANDQLDYLDDIVTSIRDGVKDARDLVGPLSTGQRLYVAMAANDMTLAPDYTIVQAIARLDDDLRELVARWQYNG